MPSVSLYGTNQFETLWLKTTIMCHSPQFCGLTRQFRYWSHLDSLPGLQSGDSPIIRSRTQSSFHGGNSGPRGQSQNRKTSGVQALRPNSTSLLPHSSFKGNPVTNTIIFSGEELGGAGNRLYLMIGGLNDRRMIGLKGPSKYFGHGFKADQVKEIHISFNPCINRCGGIALIPHQNP